MKSTCSEVDKDAQAVVDRSYPEYGPVDVLKVNTLMKLKQTAFEMFKLRYEVNLMMNAPQ